ncbi:shTK domain protein [Cooperia oncophora]
MLCIAVVCFALASSVSAAFTDMNCTNGDATATAFIASATACDDKYAATTCATLFGTAVVAGSTTDRDAKCLTDEDVKALAIANPRVKCSTVTPAQCRDPTWRPILAQDCPNVCGLCLDGGCVDTVIECKNDPSICRQVDMQSFVKVKLRFLLSYNHLQFESEHVIAEIVYGIILQTNCMRTCGYCPAAVTTAAAVVAVTTAASASSTCSDSSSSCATWVANGFCANAFYTTAQKRSYCGRSCGLC